MVPNHVNVHYLQVDNLTLGRSHFSLSLDIGQDVSDIPGAVNDHPIGSRSLDQSRVMRDKLQLVVYRERSLVDGALDSSLVAFGRPVVKDTLWKGHSQTDVPAVEAVWID